jgi:hypothetical protein
MVEQIQEGNPNKHIHSKSNRAIFQTIIANKEMHLMGMSLE